MSISPTTYGVAQLLQDIGWRNNSDAQYGNLDAIIRNGALVEVLFSAESALRDRIDAEAQP